MPWMECSPVSQRAEFVTLIETQAVSFAELCRRFGVSRRTGYEWLGRFQADGRRGLTDCSRRRLARAGPPRLKGPRETPD